MDSTYKLTVECGVIACLFIISCGVEKLFLFTMEYDVTDIRGTQFYLAAFLPRSQSPLIAWCLHRRDNLNSYQFKQFSLSSLHLCGAIIEVINIFLLCNIKVIKAVEFQDEKNRVRYSYRKAS